MDPNIVVVVVVAVVKLSATESRKSIIKVSGGTASFYSKFYSNVPRTGDHSGRGQDHDLDLFDKRQPVKARRSTGGDARRWNRPDRERRGGGRVEHEVMEVEYVCTVSSI